MVARRLLLVALVLSAAACKPKKQEDEKPAEPAPPKSVSESEKSNAYIECSNRFVSRAYQSRDRYLSWVDAKKGPTGKEDIVYGVYTLVGDVKVECRDRLTAVSNGPSMPELEAAGEHLTASLETLAPLLEEANDYFSGKDYQRDAWAKGKELHPKLMAAFEAFEKADAEMGAVLDAREDASLESQLAELSKSPDPTGYVLTNVIYTGKKLVHLASGVDDIGAIDLAAFQAALETFAAAVVDCANRAKDPNVRGFATGAARAVVVQASLLVERRVKKTKWSSGDLVMINGGNPAMVDGHPAAVVSAYNDMIGASNRL
jgi:hypothetical protein